MDKVMDRLEGIMEKVVSDLEERPVSTGVKLVVIMWLVKKAYGIIKGA